VWKASVTTELGEAAADSVLKLIATLEEDDDVQAVFSNFEVDEAVLAKLTAA
jgi:transcriptional/translational regulatory protein YebC/TACO1